MGGYLQRVLRNIQDRRYGFIPYAAICHFHRQVELSDRGNHLEGGEVRGNMRVEQNSAFGRKAKNFRPDCDFFTFGRCFSFHFVCLSFSASPNDKNTADKINDGTNKIGGDKF